ncbi:FBP C-terminal treble-clef zinc-finger [Amycolatopsis lurida]|uniref:Fibronectin-binding protein n=1 Tax=Amycolatopsis lurida NRRL 2430 TaxID=1460371 RepID=A0A2P2FYN3_AMYLU|nr:FBP domain-containing protein [Amycolatopsis lurida]KFU81827.1 fibronectin-binding protein [Amycolatopsis lurida NRRL 2430]SEB32603.1 FBP C-terminal treble-clef zinc-finger [Amycolatopsis lurida]
MRPITRDEVRGAIVNLEPAEKRVRLPAWFDDVSWHEIDYLGWRDLRAPKRAYLVTATDDQAFGVLLRQAPNHAFLASRAMMCDLCRSSRRFNEVSLFTAQRSSRDKRRRLSARGLHLCTDLDCMAIIRSKPVRQSIDSSVEDAIKERSEGLRSRMIAFIRSVAEVEPTTL